MADVDGTGLSAGGSIVVVSDIAALTVFVVAVVGVSDIVVAVS